MSSSYSIVLISDFYLSFLDLQHAWAAIGATVSWEWEWRVGKLPWFILCWAVRHIDFFFPREPIVNTLESFNFISTRKIFNHKTPCNAILNNPPTHTKRRFVFGRPVGDRLCSGIDVWSSRQFQAVKAIALWQSHLQSSNAGHNWVCPGHHLA